MKNDELYSYIVKLGALMRLANQNIKNVTNLSGLEAKLLNQISLNNKQAAASTLAKENNVTIAAVMHCLVELEKKGYLVKEINDDDNRKKFYILTPKGEKQVKMATYIFQKVADKYLDYLGDDIEAFTRIIKKTIAFINEEEEKNV